MTEKLTSSKQLQIPDPYLNLRVKLIFRNTTEQTRGLTLHLHVGHFGTITILDVIHISKHDVLEAEFCFLLQVEPTQRDPIQKIQSPCQETIESV
jgi:hypothetical protein